MRDIIFFRQIIVSCFALLYHYISSVVIVFYFLFFLVVWCSVQSIVYRRHMNIKCCWLDSWHSHSIHVHHLLWRKKIQTTAAFIEAVCLWWRYSRWFFLFRYDANNIFVYGKRALEHNTPIHCDPFEWLQTITIIMTSNRQTRFNKYSAESFIREYETWSFIQIRRPQHKKRTTNWQWCTRICIVRVMGKDIVARNKPKFCSPWKI